MIEELIRSELDKSRLDIARIDVEKTIDCVGIFTTSDANYDELNNELRNEKLVDEMASGNLYYLNSPIHTEYGDLRFVKVRKHDENYDDYRVYIDFVVNDYEAFKSKLDNPTIKQFGTFELIELKNETSIINVVSLSAASDYNL